MAATEIDKLQEMPWKAYLAAATKALQRLNQELGPGGGGLRRGFNPVGDGVILPHDPSHPEPAPTAPAGPMLLCSPSDDQSPSWTDASLDHVAMAEQVETVTARAALGPAFG